MNRFYRETRKNCAVLIENDVTAYQFGTEAFTGGPATFTVSEWSADAN